MGIFFIMVKAFISYSSKNIVFAKRLKEFLDAIEIESFLADDDIRIAEDWKERILNELNTCQIIIPILSKDFKNSDWCSQEIGIFYFLKKIIIPISVDGTRSYGFIGHIQSKSIGSDITPELLVAEGLGKCYNYKPLIYLLKKAGSFRYSENIFKVLEQYFDKLNKDDVNIILDISIKNGQIWSAAECADRYLPNLLAMRKDVIEHDLMEKIMSKIKQ